MADALTPSVEIRGQSILILGYGIEGKTTHEFLLRNYPQLEISVADKRLTEPPDQITELFNGLGYLEHLGQFETVVRSPGISQYQPQIKNFIQNGGYLTTATNIFFSLAPGMTIGVTGTKGKSTTSALIAHLLKEQFTDVRLVGNIGSPMLEGLSEATGDTIFVIELSSHQLADCRYSPLAAVILDIVPEHLDYYPDLTTYTKAKGRIIASQTSSDVVIYNQDSQTATTIAQNSAGKKLSFSTHEKTGLTWIEEGIVMAQGASGPTPVIELARIPLKGNQSNVLAAAAVAVHFSLPTEKIAHGLSTFAPLSHRLEFVGEHNGILFYNDSLATVPQATIHALEGLGPNVETLVAGGFDRGIDYTILGQFLLEQPGLKTLILFPDTGEKIWAAIEAAASHKPQAISYKIRLAKYNVISMKQAVEIAYQTTTKGKICLLSPAAASFNLFKDYKDRGEQFRQAVQEKVLTD